eukprot:gene2414-4684_t
MNTESIHVKPAVIRSSRSFLDDTGLSYLILSIFFFYLGSEGYRQFLKCDFVRKPESEWSSPAGYTKSHFAWLFVGSYLLPLGLIMSFFFLFRSYKCRINNNLKLILYYGLLAVMIYCAIASYNMGADVLKCGILFCSEDDTNDNNNNPPAPVVFVGIFLQTNIEENDSFIYTGLGYGTGSGGQELLSPSLIQQYKKSNKMNILSIIATFTILYPIIFIACISLPTWWNNFTSEGINTYRKDAPDTSYGEFFLFITLLLLILFQFFYFFFQHGWEQALIPSRSYAERAARSMGQVSNLLTGLLVLPVSRNNIWSIVFGISWEVLWWKVYVEQGTFPHDILA